MGFEPDKAAIRFGEGLSPVLPSPSGVGEILAQLSANDHIAKKFPIRGYETVRPDLVEISKLRRKSRRAKTAAAQKQGEDLFRKANRALQRKQVKAIQNSFIRSVTTNQPFRERLVRYWADHFTVVPGNLVERMIVVSYVEETIRPHISGRFSDMLSAVVKSPAMLESLDQPQSIGPNSRVGIRQGRGINENLAREVLELHTLGVSGSYSQTDVRQLAELFTGLSISRDTGFRFRPAFAEPGVETILGKRYGGGTPSLSHIEDALLDIANHPETAKHLARKLASHFVADEPPANLVSDLTNSFLETDGDLAKVYETLVGHPASWALFGSKIKQPIDFVISSFRALNVSVDRLEVASFKDLKDTLLDPLASMGQPMFQPSGPDGWPEEAEAWIHAQGLGARLQWAMALPAVLGGVPDPRDIAKTALGTTITPKIEFAAANAESRAEGIGLILSSPTFQRR